MPEIQTHSPHPRNSTEAKDWPLLFKIQNEVNNIFVPFLVKSIILKFVYPFIKLFKESHNFMFVWFFSMPWSEMYPELVILGHTFYFYKQMKGWSKVFPLSIFRIIMERILLPVGKDSMLDSMFKMFAVLYTRKKTNEEEEEKERN